MFSLIITLLLINTYSGSLGNPIFSQSRSSIVRDLSLLATSCDNPFLSSQITSNKECTSETVTNNEELFKCLMFYDINAQLCNSSKKLLTNETDFQASMSASLDVKKVCDLAKNWVVSKLPKYAIYKTTIDKILSTPAKCHQMCEIDILNEEANFICKYFNWGSSILNRTDVQEAKPEIKEGLSLAALASDKKVEEPILSSIPSVTSIPLPNNNEKKIPKVHEAVLKPVETPTDLSSTLSTAIKPESVPPAGSTANQAISGRQSLDTIAKPHEESKILPSAIDQKPSAVSEGLQKAGDTQDIDATALQEHSNLPVVNGNNVLDNPNVVLNKPALEELKPKPGKPDDDYQGSDEGLGDIQGGDDGEDAVVGEVEMKPKPAVNTSVKKVESSVFYKGDVSQREFYANSIPDDFSGDDDHFFPLFLTAIVFVVLLYVLYHNKSKVTKVVLGLIVEGRQPGRRRNSRGHAYRRLDTLEQAMSANSTAPPSKIIY